jgi:hypothetical protein
MMKLTNEQRKHLREVLKTTVGQVRNSIESERNKRAEGVVAEFVAKSPKIDANIRKLATLRAELSALVEAHEKAVEVLKRKMRVLKDAFDADGLTVNIEDRNDRCRTRYHSRNEYEGVVVLDADTQATIEVDACNKKAAAAYVQGRLAELYDAEEQLDKLVTLADETIAVSEYPDPVSSILERIRALEQ